MENLWWIANWIPGMRLFRSLVPVLHKTDLLPVGVTLPHYHKNNKRNIWPDMPNLIGIYAERKENQHDRPANSAYLHGKP